MRKAIKKEKRLINKRDKITRNGKKKFEKKREKKKNKKNEKNRKKRKKEKGSERLNRKKVKWIKNELCNAAPRI